MILLAHITIAILTLIGSVALFVSPTNRFIRFTSIATFLTIVSGSVLLIQNSAYLLRSCLFGLAIVTVSVGSLLYAKKAITVRTK